MSFKAFMERHQSNILACIVVIICVFALVASNILFWIVSPFVLFIYFWRKYNFWIVLGVSLYLFIVSFLFMESVSVANDAVNIASHLLILGAMIGIASYGEKKIEYLRKIKFEKYLLPYLLIAILVIVVGAYYGIWNGTLLGDDAFVHAARTQFIVDNFPNINWYPSWFLGFNMFDTSPFMYYLLLAIANFLTGISVPQLMIISIFVFNFLLGVAVYKFSKLLGLPWFVSTGFSLVFLTLPVIWMIIWGGAYMRMPARAFFVISIAAAYFYTLKINKKEDSWYAYLLAVFLLAFTILLHPLFGGGIFAAVATALMYSLAVKGAKQKVKTLLKVFIPIGGLISIYFLPVLSFLMSGSGGGNVVGADLELGSLESIFTDSNPMLLPLTILLVAVSLFVYKKYGKFLEMEKIYLALIFLLFSLYSFLCGWLPMPEQILFMSVYTYQRWFGFFLALFLITLSSLIYTSFSSSYPNRLSQISKKPNILSKQMRKNKDLFVKSLSVTIIFMIFAAFAVSLSTVKVMNLNPDDPKSMVNPLSVVMGQIDNEVPNNFRLAATSRRVYALQPYEYPQLEFTGGRQRGALHAEYISLFIERVSSRYHEDPMRNREERSDYYSEIPDIQYSSSNFFSSMFWMDWFGVDGVMVTKWEQSKSSYPTYYEYKLKPQYYNATEMSGGLTYVRYPESSPIVVSTNASTVGILNDGKEADELYNAVLITLGELNLNSQWIIPLKLEISDLNGDLQGINTILVTSKQYTRYEPLLQEYVNDGGNLAIMDYEPNNSGVKRAELVGSSLSFGTYASPIIPQEDSEVIAKTENNVVIYRYKVGMGSIINSSVSVQELYEDASAVASAVLGKIIIPDFDITHFSPQMDTWHVSSRRSASGVVSHLDNEEVLKYELMQNDSNQVNFRVFFENKASTSATGLIQFGLWNDGETEDLGLNLISSHSSNYLSYDLSNSSWVGWKRFSVPLASFDKSPSVTLLSEFDGIDLVIVNGTQSLENSEHTLKIKDLNYYEVTSKSTYQSLDYVWVHPNQLNISMEENSAVTKLLVKESYDENWNIATDPVTPGVKYYFAGPGVMFVYVPSSVQEVSFTMPLEELLIIGIFISVSTLSVLLIFLLYHLARRKSIFNPAKRAETF